MEHGSISVPPILVADHPAIDFVNSWARPGGVETDWLSDGHGLVNWLAAAKIGEPAEVRAIGKTASARALDAAAGRARDLRGWFRGVLTRHAGKPLGRLTAAQLSPLNDLLAGEDGYRQVESGGQSLTWKTHRRPMPADRALLLPVADAIGELLTREDFSLVRFCEGSGCVLAFLDRTKSHGRRWCSMAGCGNRAKAAAHRARVAGHSLAR
jgi:predicted RNA-binding Zn ribbon-like protein